MKLVKITAAGLFLVALAINVKVTLEDPFVMVNEQALAEETTGTIERLKKVDCTCPETGKSGFTLKCKTDGNLELCTPTQQGSEGCYKISLLGGLELLCEPNNEP